jgi:FAD dependent oxidoreductase
VPYGALVPASLDGLLVASRAVSSDATSHSFLRKVPRHWIIGQAAGAVLRVREVPVGRTQDTLAEQWALVRTGAEAAA